MASSRTRAARPGIGLGISRALSRHAGGGDVCAQRGSDEKAGFSVAGADRVARGSPSVGTDVARDAVDRCGHHLRPGEISRRGTRFRYPRLVIGRSRVRVCRPPLRDRAPTGSGRVGITGAAPRPTLVPVRQRARLTRNASSRTRTFYFANITSQGSDETRKTARRRPTRRRARRGGETARRETREERKNARTVRKRARWRADSWQTLPGVSARKDESVSSFLHIFAAVGGQLMDMKP